jgi:hypothetical protein
MCMLARVALRAGDLAGVRSWAERARMIASDAGDHTRARSLIAESRRRLADADTTGLTPYLKLDEATVAAIDGDVHTASRKLAEAEEEFRSAAVVPDPDDAAEIARLRERLHA